MEKVGDPGRQRHPQHPSSLRRRTGSRVGIYFGTLAFLLVLSAIDLVKTSSMLRKVHGIIAKELKTDAPFYVGVPNNPTSNNDIDGDNVHGGEGKEIPVVVSPPSSHDADHDFRKRFEYDVERWNKHKPKIVILVGPHKTASSTLQTFLTQLAGQTIALGTDETTETTSDLAPNPSNHEWIWPVQDRYELDALGIKSLRQPAKIYAQVAALVTGRRIYFYFPKILEFRRAGNSAGLKKYNAMVVTYYRSVFRKVWETKTDGSNHYKNIVIGAEAFDAFVKGLKDTRVLNDDDDETNAPIGEALHVPGDAKTAIGKLMSLFIWKGNPGDENASFRRPPPTLNDFEVHVNYRTPRIDHVISTWHQQGHKRTLRQFLGSTNELYQLNSLALALQFARLGIKTTIVDMKGVSEKEERERTAAGNAAAEISTDEAESNRTIISGIRGVIACDILQMGDGRAATSGGDGEVENQTKRGDRPGSGDSLWCDEHSRLHLPPPGLTIKNVNQKSDHNERDLTEDELLAVGRELDAYDCDVWKYLRPYVAKGTLRILYPSEMLFASCHRGDGEQEPPQVSFAKLRSRLRAIAERWV
eukprot:CAMPEP_0172363748 /NCGR_PEP_ID=MMETSP1060-20121228/7021_1 /TAXON_ID=37318 /ORGANISM="Pseudo-nitzschia pungens, Strain cf. cingulata" /LENGTH=585 /DNA_ID=CAMNT_0013086559 /DNA_START=166 /DNA_END=1923 /DNA_ORIENTATION=+